MDIEGIAWILILFFYFIARALGGKKKGSNTPGRPQPEQRPPVQRKPGRIGTTGNAELDDALAEIRRALGFPDDADRRSRTGDGAAGEPDRGPGTLHPERTLDSREQVERPLPRVEHPAAVQRTPGTDRPKRPASVERPTRVERPLKPVERPSKQVEDRFRQFERPLDTVKPPRKLTSAGTSFTAQPRKPGPLERSLRLEGTRDRVVATDGARQRRSQLIRTLQDQDSVREAFIMKELIDRPLALRRRSGPGRRD